MKSEKVKTLFRIVLGWHLAYLGVWALTSEATFSWYGRFHSARWLFGSFFRWLSDSAAAGALDLVLAWGLLVAGILLMVGRAVKGAAIFGVVYFALMYLVNPPHFGHTGVSHVLYIDRSVIEIVMLLAVAFPFSRKEVEA